MMIYLIIALLALVAFAGTVWGLRSARKREHAPKLSYDPPSVSSRDVYFKPSATTPIRRTRPLPHVPGTTLHGSTPRVRQDVPMTQSFPASAPVDTGTDPATTLLLAYALSDTSPVPDCGPSDSGSNDSGSCGGSNSCASHSSCSSGSSCSSSSSCCGSSGCGGGGSD